VYTDGRAIDGEDISDLIKGTPAATTPHEAILYYKGNLEAVRSGKWKYHLGRNTLYDLEADISESNDVSAQNPTIVQQLTTLAQGMHDEMTLNRRSQGDQSAGNWITPANHYDMLRAIEGHRGGSSAVADVQGVINAYVNRTQL
jgi:hypothetical protein